MKLFRAFILTLCAYLAALPVVYAQWQVPQYSAPVGRGSGATGFDFAAPGTAGSVYMSNGPSANPSFQMPGALTSFVTNMTALRALSPGYSSRVEMGGYYTVGVDPGSFTWVPGDVTADNGGTVIQPNAGGTGRWFRKLPYANRVTPEDFGARHNGTDDQPYAQAAANYISSLPNGGTVWGTDGYIYTIGPTMATARTVLKWPANVSFDGTGTFKLGNNTNKASATATATCSGTSVTLSGITGTPLVNDFVYGAGFPPATQLVSGSGTSWVASQACTASGTAITTTTVFARMLEAVAADGNIGSVSVGPLTWDYNGLNNNCSPDQTAANGKCWAFNAIVTAQVADRIDMNRTRFLNNGGSNDTVFGTNTLPPTVTNLNLNGLYHNNSGDRVNAAAADWSADFFIALNVTMNGIRCYNGPTVNGSCFEIHGSGVTASDIAADNYFNCGIIANEVLSPGTNNVTMDNVSCINTNYGGIQLYSRPGTSSINITVDKLHVINKTGVAGWGIDACSVVDPTSTNINLTVNGMTYFSDATGNLGNDTSGICLGNFVTAKVTGSQFYNTQGPAIRVKGIASGESLTLTNNQIYQPGHTSTTSLQAGIVLDASANVASTLNIQNNPISGAVRYGVINAGVNASGGAVFGNAAPGATVDQYSWTGTGVSPGIPVKYLNNGTGASSTTFWRGDGTWSPVTPSPAGTSGQIQYNNAGALAGFTMAGDCTISIPNITCTKTGGVAFGGLATVVPGSGVVTAAGTALNTAGGLAPVTSPALGGTPTAPTAAVNTNTTQIATTAFVAGQASAATPLADTTAGSVGTSLKFAREDHTHPAANANSQLWFAAGNLNAMTQNATWFFGGGGNAAAAEGVVVMPMSQAGTVDQLYCATQAAPAAGQTFTLTLRKNAADTTLGGASCQITSAGTTCNDTNGAHAVSVVAGDILDMKLVTSATSGTANGMNCGVRLKVLSP